MSSSTDFTTLGRLGASNGAKRRRGVRAATAGVGASSSSGSSRARRSKSRGGGGDGVQAVIAAVPLSRLIGVGLVALLVVLWLVGRVIGVQTEVLSAVTVATPSVDPQLQAELARGEIGTVATGSISLVPGGGSGARTVQAPAAFAAVEDIALYLPLSSGSGVVFMEADTAAALPLAPVGTMTDNSNPEGFTPSQEFSGPDYMVEAPISGVRPATGMAALLAAPGTVLKAPVQGTVVAVTSYTTETGEQDWRVVLQPVGRPDLQVVVRRIEAPLVAAGDLVTVGVTDIGTVRPGSVVSEEHNPLALPSPLLYIQPALDPVGVDPSVPAAPVAPGAN
ncbi:MAG: hypothetical protein ACR2HR_05900 [Euzebya sp.]